jgi:pimeloyl-ACP methyl ester carboxylesterase
MKNLLSFIQFKKLIVSLSLLLAAPMVVFSQPQSVNTALKNSPTVTIHGTESGTPTPIGIIINNNGIHLDGKLYVSENSGTLPFIIFLHGFPGNEPIVFEIGMKLSEAGYNVLTFNYSGTFKREGKFNFPNTQKDIEAAYNFIHQPENIAKFSIDTSRIILGGYSLGGGMALTYAANHPEVKEVFSLSGNDHGAFIRNYQQDAELRKKIDGLFDEFKSNIDMVRFAPGGMPKEFLEMKIIESNPTFDLRYCAPFLAPKNILLIGGWNDMNVPIENIVLPLYRALYKAKASNVKISAVQDSHSFKKSGDTLKTIIIEWIKSNGKD